MNNKNMIMFVVLFSFSLILTPYSLTAKDSGKKKVSGIVEEVSFSGDYIVLDGKKFFIPEELASDYFIQEGDNIELTVVKTDKGLEVVNIEYLFDTESGFTYTYSEEELPDADERETP